ncbi:methyltransferase domain-containing protein [Streptosporangium carneum]|uniref:Cytochrome c domain-containing protein n=1 Tax=Streptosporangium carneum TaxID=47481 RepID=A0A9W6HXV5_9ACTN|nr:methyltransferase domain-containing protein [Streptosporangium carneum]GLK08296.1 hypothetical protein GCM10017600_17010 [Streptosporangium carneum]
MKSSTTHPTVAELLDSFTDAAPERRDARYGRLVGALWNDGALTGLALPAVPALVARLEEVDDGLRGYLAVLLGLLAEAEFPATDGEVSAAVRRGLDLYLDLLGRGANGQPSTLALLYLLAHFPGDRERVLAVAEKLSLDQEDLTRTDRILRRPDRDNPDLGRVWPSPSVWALDDGERDFDQAWIRELSDAQFLRNWQNDTRTLMGHSGAKAYWAVLNGPPKVVATPSVPAGETLRAASTGSGAELFARHADAFRCPNCHGPLSFGGDGDGGVRCAGCDTAFPIANGILDLFPGTRGSEVADDVTADLLQKLAAMPTMGLYYEAVLRPAFLRAIGSNWGGAVTLADEDAHIAEHVSPVDGPVLDLGAGAGRWTAVLAEAVGAERVIALDVGVPMLTALRARLPRVPAILGSGGTLPFGDATLGAAMCWNALQAFPDEAAAAIAEVGRCLRPGGTFTLMTFRWSPDPVYRHFQRGHHFPNHEDGLRLLELDDVRTWLAEAGMTVRAESGPGTFVFVTAERT